MEMKKKNDILKNRIRGSIVGGAIGDALGYPVEFMSHKDIMYHYGQDGITHLVKEPYVGKAIISDDTQMTLFTALGILNGASSQCDLVDSVTNAYIEWYYTQQPQAAMHSYQCFIAAMPEFRAWRAPGATCISALDDIAKGRVVVNNSKGCGGVMRIAPLPLYALSHEQCDASLVAKLAADITEITHKHPLAYIPAAFLSHLIYSLAGDEYPTRHKFLSHIGEAMAVVRKLFAACSNEIDTFRSMVGLAVDLADTDMSDYDAIHSLGEGWVAEEAVAIAIYCVCKYFDNFEAALIAAVNHNGDSDSTGAITGNILGAAIGYDAIPNQYKEDIELHDVILKIADGIYYGAIDA